MKNLREHINEAWAGVKKHTISQPIIAWCDEMGIENYTINSQSEIDVNGDVNLRYSDFKELPYKFGQVNGLFSLTYNKNLISLKNCPNKVNKYFGCGYCPILESLEGCPKEVKGNFWCSNCKRKFTEKEVKSLCKVKGNILV